MRVVGVGTACVAAGCREVLLLCVCFRRGGGFYSMSSDYCMGRELYKAFQHPLECCSKGLRPPSCFHSSVGAVHRLRT